MSAYPKMLYRDGEGLEHLHCEQPLLVGGKHKVDTLVVQDEDEELAALTDGWRDTAAPADESPKRGPGRPKQTED